MSRPILVFFNKALEAGERWITVHPPGHEKGQPILIQQQSDGSAKVIGGAGGSLNHLRLTGVKPESSYEGAIKERAGRRREIRAEQRARDKAAGLTAVKAEAHRKIKEQEDSARSQFVEGVAKALGWDPEAYKFDPSKHADLPPDVVEKMARAHGVEMLRKAKAAVAVNREKLLSDADARGQAELGQVPLLSESPDVLSVQDLDPVRPENAGLGFAPEYGERAADAGLTKEALTDEADTVKAPKTEEQRKAAIAAGETAKLVKENMDLFRDGDKAKEFSPKLVAAKQAVDLLKLEKKLKLAEKAARDARREVVEAQGEPKAYVLDVDDAKVDADVADAVANDLRTIRTRAFLSEAAKESETADLGRHVGAGAYNSINALALAAGGEALVDRSVVDVLGIAGAAEILARRLNNDLAPEEIAQVSAGMKDYHLHHYMEASQEAIDRARELHDQAKEISLGEAETGGDLAAMQEVNKRRGEALGEAQRVLGQALGEMEANAALVYALEGGKSEKPLKVSLGKVSVESAIQQVRAIGLDRGDYTIETVSGNRVLTVAPAGMDKLAKPVNRADLEQVRRNLDIIEGKHDEEGWMPLGISDRADLDMHPEPGVAPQFAVPFTPSENLDTDIADYIGGRAADGDAPADIVADLQSAEFLQKVGPERVEAYLAALDKIAPLQDANGKMRPAEALQPSFDKMADDFVAAHYGSERAPLQRQKFDIDDVATDSLHRALAAEPTGVSAYKPIGELTSQDQRALREFFGTHIAKDSPDAAAARKELEDAETSQPEKSTTDMFGETVTNPEWTEWRNRRDNLRTRISNSTISWPKYVESMRGQENAYAAVQDVVRGRVSKTFADTYNSLSRSPIKVGHTVVRNNLNHLDSIDPDKREARMAKERALIDRMRARASGRYAAGGVKEKLDARRAEQAGLEASQMGFFSESSAPPKSLEADERYTIGHEAENQIAGMMSRVGQNFRPGEPVKLFRPTMSGGKNWPRQRAIKMIEANKRVVLSFGTGGGKTLITMAGFTNLQQQGKAKRGLFLVPSIVQGQFNGEALRFLKPGTFKWHAKPGADRAERIAAYKDQGNNFAVMTHQSFRDDMVYLAAQHAGIPENEMAGKVDSMSRDERKAWMRDTMRREGINFDYMTVDEGQNTLNRIGKEDSNLANVVDAATDNANYYVSASADPIKNDVSESFSLLQKMDGQRYTDEKAFMRRYGVDTLAAKDGLRREMARFQYPSRIDPDITATRIERKVELTDADKASLNDIDKTAANVRISRMEGKVDVAGLKKLSPSSFDGVADDQIESVARDLAKNVGILKDAAVRRALNGESKVNDIAKIAEEKRGKPGVVFTHSLADVESVAKRLRDEGYRVVSMTGKDSAKSKSEKRIAFNPDSGDASADILVASDAGSTGMSVQRGQWLVNMDTPQTAMTHAQRNGRINRVGQTNNVDLIDLVADHPQERHDRDRLVKKYALRDMMTTPMESLDDTGLAYFLRQRASQNVDKDDAA